MRLETKLQQTLTAQYPNDEELRGSTIFVDEGCVLPPDWPAILARHEARVVTEVYKASVFVAMQPWMPNCALIKLAVRLNGGLLLTPDVLSGPSGACARYEAALKTKRIIWVSDAFRTSHQHEWHVLLEAMVAYPHRKWKLLPNPQAYAAEKVKAQAAKRSAEVLALLAVSEFNRNTLPHVFDFHGFLRFIEKRDVAHTSFGICEM